MSDNEKLVVAMHPVLGGATCVPMWDVRIGGQYSTDIIADRMTMDRAMRNARSWATGDDCENIAVKTDPADDTQVPMVEYRCSDHEAHFDIIGTAMQTEIAIESSHGRVYVFTDGTISRFTGAAETQFGAKGVGITKFDLSDEAVADGHADIMTVGYWHRNGYEEAFDFDVTPEDLEMWHKDHANGDHAGDHTIACPECRADGYTSDEQHCPSCTCELVTG